MSKEGPELAPGPFLLGGPNGLTRGLVHLAKGAPVGAIFRPHQGVILMLCHLGSAAKLNEIGVIIVPHHVSAHSLLAAALENMGQPGLALAHLQDAARARSDSACIHSDLGDALRKQGKPTDAIREYEAAIALDSSSARAHLGLGITLASIGRRDEARAILEKATNIDPTNCEAYFYLVKLARVSSEDPLFQAMQSLARAGSQLPESSQTLLHFALGKVYADVGNFDVSFEHLRQGNALRRKETVYAESKILTKIARTRTQFSHEFIRSKIGLGHPSSRPLFIVGMHRSGSTLVEQIIASHPRCFGAGEIPDINFLASAVDDLGYGEFPEAVKSLTASELDLIARSYLSVIDRVAGNADRVTDKMPNNFVHVGFIHLLFPNARIIHTRRDPRDTAISCYSAILGEGLGYTCDLSELGRFYKEYRLTMAHWRNVLPGGVMLEVDYESLVKDFNGQVRRILAHCGLDWADSCKEFYLNQRPIHSSSAGQVHQPIYDSSIGRWRDYEKFLRPFLQALEGDEVPGETYVSSADRPV